jgi:hypothetical protein
VTICEHDAATEALPGSGEGLAHLFARWVSGGRDDPGHCEQYNKCALLIVNEIGTLAALSARTGSTLGAELRKAWMGQALGFHNADKSKRLHVAQHAYRLNMIICSQPGNADALLADAVSGTPQRVVWCSVVDPDVQRRPSEPPDPFAWKIPNLPAGARAIVPVCETAANAIRDARYERARGNTAAALDGHALFLRERLATKLGLLDGIVGVTDDNWHWAGEIMRLSDATREAAQAAVARQAAVTNRARGRAAGMRAEASDELRRERAEARIGRRLTARLADRWVPRREIRKWFSTDDRALAMDVLADLVRKGSVAVETRGKGRCYRCR